MKGSKESRQNRSQVSASFHRRTEHGGKEEEWMDGSDASFSKSLAFGRNLTPASWWKDQKTELFPSFNSASFHIKTEPGGKEEGWKWRQLVGSQLLPSADHASPSQHQLPPKMHLEIHNTKENRFESPPFDCTVLIHYSTSSIIPTKIKDFVVPKADIITT